LYVANKDIVTIQNPASSRIQGIGGGWHVRTPGEYFDHLHLQGGGHRGDFYAETIHSSVDILLSRKVVTTSLGLRHLKPEVIGTNSPRRYNFRPGPKKLFFLSRKNNNDHTLFLTEEPGMSTEAQLVATWTSRKFLTSLLPEFTKTSAKLSITNAVVSIGVEVGNTTVKLSRINEVVPIFAVLHKPEAWEVVSKSTIFPSGKNKKKKNKRVANGTPVTTGLLPENDDLQHENNGVTNEIPEVINPPQGNNGPQHENTGHVRLFIQGSITVNVSPGNVSTITNPTTTFELDRHWNKDGVARFLGNNEAEYLVGNIAVPFSHSETGENARPEQFSAIDPGRQVRAEREVGVSDPKDKGKGRAGTLVSKLYLQMKSLVHRREIGGLI
jgi:hypothetical protein